MFLGGRAQYGRYHHGWALCQVIYQWADSSSPRIFLGSFIGWRAFLEIYTFLYGCWILRGVNLAYLDECTKSHSWHLVLRRLLLYLPCGRFCCRWGAFSILIGFLCWCLRGLCICGESPQASWSKWGCWLILLVWFLVWWHLGSFSFILHWSSMGTFPQVCCTGFMLRLFSWCSDQACGLLCQMIWVRLLWMRWYP